MNVILCGMMGAGKTTVGICLAEITQSKWLDTDALIEERYGKIADIFAEKGEGYFRGLERETVNELSALDGLVLSVGGGLVLRKRNVKRLKEKGKIVYLRASISTLFERLQADNTRPLLQGRDLQKRLVALLGKREGTYQAVADIVVDVDGKLPRQIAEEIVALLG